MTAIIHHGPPGSYKSFGVLQDEVVPALMAGRTVVTNVRGLDSVERIESALDIDVPEEAQLISIPHNAEGFETMAKWFHWVPKGALLFMDEGQRIYSTRLRSLHQFDYPGGIEQAQIDVRPATLEDAFDQHRHHNWDIYITTTNIAKIHKEILQVCEYGYRHRNLTGLLPWYKNKWKEVQHDPSTSGKSAYHSIGQPIIKKADPRYFGCYESTQTGKTGNDIKNPAIFKQPKVLFFMVLILFAIGYQGWYWGFDEANSNFELLSAQVDKPGVSDSAAVRSAVSNGDIRQSDYSSDLRADSTLDYLDHPAFMQRAQYLGYINGRHKRTHLFRFYDDHDRYYEITDKDLKEYGIDVKVVGCVAKIELAGKHRFINCYNEVPFYLNDRQRDDRAPDIGTVADRLPAVSNGS